MSFKNTVLLFGVLLTGCVLPPKESAHPAALANTRVGLTGAAVEPIPEGWWKSFDDPQLDSLIRLGLKDSPNLAQAQARVADALAFANCAIKAATIGEFGRERLVSTRARELRDSAAARRTLLLGGAGGRQLKLGPRFLWKAGECGA